MHKPALALVVALVVAFPTPSPADGLLYQLPKDGTWARFRIDGKAKQADGTPVTLVGTMTLSSVGTTAVDGQRCRWIEIATEGKRNDEEFTEIDKLLIPEKHLARGQRPLQHVLKVWHQHSQLSDVPREIKQADALRAHCLKGGIRHFLHGPFKTEEKLARALVTSKLGKLKCEGIKATEQPDDGGASLDFTYIIRLHKKAPFGVVTWELKAKLEHNGQTVSMTTKLTLSDFGKDAKSALPQCK